MFFFKLKLWLLIVIVGFIFPCGFAAEQQYVRIGVLALRGKDTCLKLWEPTAAFLTSNIPEYKFKIVPLAYSEIIDSVRNRKVDFILVNSSIYVTLEMEYNVSRIASHSSGPRAVKPSAARSGTSGPVPKRSVGGGGLVFFAVLFLFGFVGFFAFTGGGAGR